MKRQMRNNTMRALVVALITVAFAACSGGGSVPPGASPVSGLSKSTLSETLSAGTVPHYRLVILGTGLVPAKINNRGVVVGTDISTNQPFVYNNGRVTKLPLFQGDNVGAAYDVNNRGQVVGYSQDTNSPFFPMHAVTWINGRVFNLGATAGYILPATNIAQVINDRGEIAGMSGLSASAGVIPLAIFAPGSVRTIDNSTGGIYGINNSGEIVGVEVLPQVAISSPFSYPNSIVCSPPLYAHGTILGINNAGDTISSRADNQLSYLCRNGLGRDLPFAASSINERDDIVGAASAAQPMLYSADKLYDARSLASTHPDMVLSENSQLKGVRNYRSSDGAVQGIILCISPGDAVLYSDGKLYDLNELVRDRDGIVLQNAVSINNRREIVGYSSTTSTPIGYLLVPERNDDDR